MVTASRTPLTKPRTIDPRGGVSGSRGVLQDRFRQRNVRDGGASARNSDRNRQDLVSSLDLCHDVKPLSRPAQKSNKSSILGNLPLPAGSSIASAIADFPATWCLLGSSRAPAARSTERLRRQRVEMAVVSKRHHPRSAHAVAPTIYQGPQFQSKLGLQPSRRLGTILALRLPIPAIREAGACLRASDLAGSNSDWSETPAPTNPASCSRAAPRRSQVEP